jgi:hypothetical protein
MDEMKFSFEDLEVWKKAIEFAYKVIQLIEKIETDSSTMSHELLY